MHFCDIADVKMELGITVTDDAQTSFFALAQSMADDRIVNICNQQIAQSTFTTSNGAGWVFSGSAGYGGITGLGGGFVDGTVSPWGGAPTQRVLPTYPVIAVDTLEFWNGSLPVVWQSVTSNFSLMIDNRFNVGTLYFPAGFTAGYNNYRAGYRYGYPATHQALSITGTPTGGTFVIAWQGHYTTAIAYNANATTVQAALTALPLTGTATVIGADLPAGKMTIIFSADIDGTPLTMIDALTGGTTPATNVSWVNVPQTVRRVAMEMSAILARESSIKAVGDSRLGMNSKSFSEQISTSKQWLDMEPRWRGMLQRYSTIVPA